MSNFLSPDQVWLLNEKHGWFKYGDGQSDVSRAFAQDAISMHESMRRSAPEMLQALNEIVGLSRALRQSGPDPMDLQYLSEALEKAIDLAHEAISKAKGDTA